MGELECELETKIKDEYDLREMKLVKSHNEQLVTLQKEIDDLKVSVSHHSEDVDHGLEVRDNIDRTSESQLAPMALPSNESRTSSSSMSVHEHSEYDPISERSMSPQSETLQKAMSIGNISSSMSSRGVPHVGYDPVPERSISPTEKSREERRRK